MTTERQLHARSASKCELCGSTGTLDVYLVPPRTEGSLDNSILICQTCTEQIEYPEKMDIHHWRCLSDSMWNQHASVQVVSWRMLARIKAEAWAQDLLNMLYLEDEVLQWAQALGESEEEEIKHVDNHGAKLETGDTVTLIKDLNVKGAGFTAKRGTAVRGISLVSDNPEQIEGRVNGQQIVILTKFVKKSA